MLGNDAVLLLICSAILQAALKINDILKLQSVADVVTDTPTVSYLKMELLSSRLLTY